MPCPPPPGLKWQNPDWFQETWTRFSTLPFLLFLYTSSTFTFITYFFCVYSGLGTSSVRSEHCNRLFQDKKKSKSTNQYILNFVTQECFQKVRYHQLQLLAKKQIFRKIYLALFVEILAFSTFLPGLFVAGPRSEEEFKKWSLELRVAV